MGNSNKKNIPDEELELHKSNKLVRKTRGAHRWKVKPFLIPKLIVIKLKLIDTDFRRNLGKLEAEIKENTKVPFLLTVNIPMIDMRISNISYDADWNVDYWLLVWRLRDQTGYIQGSNDYDGGVDASITFSEYDNNPPSLLDHSTVYLYADAADGVGIGSITVNTSDGDGNESEMDIPFPSITYSGVVFRGGVDLNLRSKILSLYNQTSEGRLTVSWSKEHYEVGKTFHIMMTPNGLLSTPKGTIQLYIDLDSTPYIGSLKTIMLTWNHLLGWGFDITLNGNSYYDNL